ncbi:MAG TPA: hypothetical protein VEO54_29510 [Thermoanaerobaculia bacterium]|nr:hypothetical protein [Thermoanaerobaculia bacterium]
MNVQRSGAASFVAQFESEEELQGEHRDNLSLGALRLPASEPVPLHTALTVTLRGPHGGEVDVQATVVAVLPDGLALAVDGDPEERLRRLLASPSAQTPWDRMRALSQMEKILLAVKADRTERALLLQDNDPRVLLSLLRNPRLTVDEVARLAKSPHLTFQIADVILKATQWMSSLDVRLGLVHNPKTPQAFALRILPTLPDAEVRAIARAGTSMALKQAALRKLQGKP